LFSSSTTAGERRTADGEQGEANCIVVPIRTELQRKLLGGDRSLVAFVELDGRAFVDKQPDEFLDEIDSPTLRAALGSLKDKDRQGQVSFVMTFSGPLEPGVVEAAQKDLFKPLRAACKAVAEHAGLKVAGVSESFNGDPQYWSKAVADVEAIDLKKAADEAGIGDEHVMVYPIRTDVSRWMAGADCVAYISKPLDGADELLISDDIRERLAKVVTKLDLPAKTKIRLSFVVAAKGQDADTRQANRDNVTRRLVGDAGEAQELAEFLGFKTSSVSF